MINQCLHAAVGRVPGTWQVSKKCTVVTLDKVCTVCRHLGVWTPLPAISCLELLRRHLPPDRGDPTNHPLAPWTPPSQTLRLSGFSSRVHGCGLDLSLPFSPFFLVSS
jgi:hypothetical protein